MALSILWLIYGLFIMRRKCQLGYMPINATRGYDLTSKPQTLEGITKRLSLDLSLRDLSILRIHFIYVKKQMF